MAVPKKKRYKQIVKFRRSLKKQFFLTRFGGFKSYLHFTYINNISRK